MKYMVVYTKTNPIITYRPTLEAAQALAAQLRRVGYSVDIWEFTANGSRQIH